MLPVNSKYNLDFISGKKALAFYKLVKRFGFENILEVIPHQFSIIFYIYIKENIV